MLDIGLPLKGESGISLPNISGLASFDDTLLGVFISHPHPDHYGLFERVHEPVRLYIGDASRRIIEAGAFFTKLPSLGKFEPRSLSDRQAVTLGPFTITPYRIDHSAFDSYCLLVEAGGKRLFYSGDIRGHGRNAHLFEELLQSPPPNIDALICEGTQLGRTPDFSYPDEQSVSTGMVTVFNETKGMCLVWCSSQNIDRLVSIWDACRQSSRQLILDLYTAEVVRAANDESLPQPGVDGVFVYLPHSQKLKIKRHAAFHITRPYYPHRIYPEALMEAAPKSVMIFRPSMLPDLQRAQCLDGASLVSSVWSGYFRQSRSVLEEIAALGIEWTHIHTSGHATVDELRRFVGGIPARQVIPIHLEDREGFAKLSNRVAIKNDHEWWEV